MKHQYLVFQFDAQSASKRLKYSSSESSASNVTAETRPAWTNGCSSEVPTTAELASCFLGSLSPGLQAPSSVPESRSQLGRIELWEVRRFWRPGKILTSHLYAIPPA